MLGKSITLGIVLILRALIREKQKEAFHPHTNQPSMKLGSDWSRLLVQLWPMKVQFTSRLFTFSVTFCGAGFLLLHRPSTDFHSCTLCQPANSLTKSVGFWFGYSWIWFRHQAWMASFCRGAFSILFLGVGWKSLIFFSIEIHQFVGIRWISILRQMPGQYLMTPNWTDWDLELQVLYSYVIAAKFFPFRLYWD